MTTHDALLRRLKEAKFQCIDGNMEETAADFDDAIFAITQLQRDNAALMEDAARYRWLRDNGRLTYIWNSALHDFEKEGHNTVSETIDAAIAKDKP